jgi:hypothetical protein
MSIPVNWCHKQAIRILCPEIIAVVTGLTTSVSLAIMFYGTHTHNKSLITVSGLIFFCVIYCCAQALYNRNAIMSIMNYELYKNSHFDILSKDCRHPIEIERKVIDDHQKERLRLYIYCGIISYLMVSIVVIFIFILW